MPIFPYKKPPPSPTMALLLSDGKVIDEHGYPVELSRLNEDSPNRTVRVWSSYDTVRSLILDGFGEGLCWNNEEIRWRHESFEDGWRNRPSDVFVLKAPFPDDPHKALRALQDWRDWLGRHRAVPVGTTGSAAWSLLRAKLRKPLWTGVGDRPPIQWTLGGRQELGLGGPGRYDGPIEHLDLPAAYAATLGTLPYGGRWHMNSTFWGGNKTPEWWARGGRPVFVRAKIRVSDSLSYGPLPRKPRKRLHYFAALLQPNLYPANGIIQGVWTWEEILAAERAGCKILKLIETWGHLAHEQTPFVPWWNAIQEGRLMRGLAGQLAKMTGNALWGRFCMDATYSSRSIVSHRKREKHLDRRPLPVTGMGMFSDHALAETVSGRVRAELFRVMELYGPDLLAAHTDGVWALNEGPPPDGWRVKVRARRFDSLNPQKFRYYPANKLESVAVYSGVPAQSAAESFERDWVKGGYE